MCFGPMAIEEGDEVGEGQFGMVCIYGFEMLGKTSEYH